MSKTLLQGCWLQELVCRVFYFFSYALGLTKHNAQFSEHSIITVNIYFILSVLPQFPTEPVDQVILENNNVTFTCNSTGVPTPSISWTYNGGLLPPSSEANGGTLALAFVRNNQNFEGNYTCTADSQAGVGISTARLVVDGK